MLHHCLLNSIPYDEAVAFPTAATNAPAPTTRLLNSQGSAGDDWSLRSGCCSEDVSKFFLGGHGLTVLRDGAHPVARVPSIPCRDDRRHRARARLCGCDRGRALRSSTGSSSPESSRITGRSGARQCIVEAFDIDQDAGLAAALIMTLPIRGPATAHQETYEHDASRGWIPASGGSFSPANRALAGTRPSAARSGPAVLNHSAQDDRYFV